MDRESRETVEKIRAENQEIMRKEDQIILKDGLTIGQGKVMEETGQD